MQRSLKIKWQAALSSASQVNHTSETPEPKTLYQINIHP